MTNELLGDHALIVESLLQRLDALCAGDTRRARVVLLRGPSGVGKSRIIREVYGRLRGVAPEPVYWPELSDVVRVDIGHVDPMAARKEVGPRPETFVWSAGALPTFGWWAFNCERLQANALQDVISAARPQMDAHLLPLLMAWRALAGLGNKARANRDRVLAQIREAAADEGVDAIMDQLESLNIAIPFAGTLLKWGWKGAKAAHRRGQERAALREDIDHRDAHKKAQISAGEELAAVMRSVVHPNLPGVVAIEDMHLMGSELAALIDQVIAPAAAPPLLVIGTVWPERFTNPQFAQWLEAAVDRASVEVIDVPSLGEADLTTLLRWYASATSNDTAHQIVTQLHNPHYLKLWLTLSKTQRHIERHHGGIDLDPDNTLSLPDDIHELLKWRWEELSEQTRRALLYASAANPIDSPLAEFIPEVIATIAAEYDSDRADHDAILEGLADAVPASWCRLGDGIEFFSEALLTGAVRRRVRNEFSDDELTAIQKATCQRLTIWIDSRRNGTSLETNPETMIAAAWFVAVTAQDPSHKPTVTGVAALRVLALAAGNAYAFATAISHMNRIIDQCAQIFGHDHPETLTSQNDLGRTYHEAGYLQLAIPVLEQTLAARERALGPDHPQTLTSRHNLAFAIYDAGGDPQLAISQFERTLAAREHVLEPGHPDTLNSQNCLASAYRSIGSLDRAVPLYERTLAARERFLGADHPDTLRSRDNLACAYQNLGDLDRATLLHEQVVGDYLRVLGPQHVETQRARNNLAYDYDMAGDFAQAIRLYEQVLAEFEQMVGSDHPHTLIIRNNLACVCQDVGDLERAIALHEQTLDVRERVLGPNHPDTQKSRQHLASAYRAAGTSTAHHE